MPKYLLLKHYRGGPEPHHPFPPMDQWAPEDVEAHIAFQRHVADLLEERGEYVEAQGLTPGCATAVRTRRRLPPMARIRRQADLIAGWFMVDVDSYERAVEIAAYVSSEPGPGGELLYDWIDLREIMTAPASGV